MESWRIDLPALTMCLLGDYTLFECSSFTLDNTPALKTLLCFDFAVYSCQTFVAIDVKSLEKCILGMNCFFRLETIQKKNISVQLSMELNRKRKCLPKVVTI